MSSFKKKENTEEINIIQNRLETGNKIILWSLHYFYAGYSPNYKILMDAWLRQFSVQLQQQT